MGAFDDLIPPQNRSRTGAFDDLIPTVGGTARGSGDAQSRTGAFDDLIPTPGPDANTEPRPPLASTSDPAASKPWQVQPKAGPIPARPDPLAISTQGAGAGLAEFAGLPVDLTTAAINLPVAGVEKAINAFLPAEQPRPSPDFVGPMPFGGVNLPRVRNPVGGSQWIKDKATPMAETAGFPVIENPDALHPHEKLAYNVNRLGSTGAATSGVGTMLSAAAKPASALARATEAFATPTVGTAAVDTAANVGAGVGTTVAENVAPNNPIADLVATFLGALTGAKTAQTVAAPRVMAGSIKDRIARDPNVPADPYTGARPSVAVANQARSVMQEHAISPTQAAADIRSKAAAYNEANMPVPTSGLMSNDEGLIALENAMRRGGAEAGDAVDTLGDSFTRPNFARRDREVAQGATDNILELQPAGANSRAATDFAKREADASLQTARQEVAVAKSKSEQAALDEQAYGDAVRGRYEGVAPAASERLDQVIVDQTMKPMQAEQSRLYSAIDPAGEVQRDASPLVAAVRSIRDAVPRGIPSNEVLPAKWLNQIETLAAKPVETGVLDAAGKPITRAEGGTIPFKDLNEMRPYLANAVRSAQSRGDYATADSLRTIKKAIDGEANRLAAEGGEAGVRAQQAIDYTRTEMGPRFGRGEGARLRAEINADDRSRSRTPPTATAGRFLRVGPGSKERAQDLQRILTAAPDPQEGIAAAREYVLSDLTKIVGSDGRINVSRLRAWLSSRSEMFNAVPGLGDEARNMLVDLVNKRNATTALQKELEQKVGALKLTERQVQDGALSLLVNADPVVAVRNVFRSRDPETAMREIVGRVRKDPEAAAGWKKAVGEYLEQNLASGNTAATSAGSRNPSLSALTNAFSRSEGVLAHVYEPSEMMSLRRAHMAVEDLARKGLAGSSKTTTAEDLVQLLRVSEVGLKTIYGQLRGGGYMRSLRLAMNVLPGLNNSQKAALLVQRSMFSPELAALLLEGPVTKRRIPAWTAKLSRWVAAGEAAREMNDGE